MLMDSTTVCLLSVRILDEVEMYEHQQPFSLSLLAIVSSFLNSFIFHIIWHGLIGTTAVTYFIDTARIVSRTGSVQ